MTTAETTRKTVEAKALPAEKLGSAAALIAESFRNEGFTRNTHKLSTPAQRRRFAYAGELRLWLSQAGGHQLLAATHGETLAGVAIVKQPTTKSVPWYELGGAVLRRAPRLVKVIGDMRWRQIVRTKPAVKLSAELPFSYYTLDILAVSPDFQGQGIGRLLLDHIHAHCDQDEQITGIYLYTGDEKNVHIYRRFGYEVLEEKQAGPLTVWHMFRPHPARDAEKLLTSLRTAAAADTPARWQRIALPILGVVGVFAGCALLWRLLGSREECCNKVYQET